MMLTDNHTVASYFARVHLDNAVRLGGNENEILTKAKLTRALLKQPRTRVSAKQLATIIRANWQVSGDELMGLTQQKIKFGVFSLLAERLVGLKTLGDVLNHTVEFYNLISDQLHFALEQTEQEVRFSVQPVFKQDGDHTTATQATALPPRSLLIEYLLLVWHRFPSWLVGQVIPLNRVCLQYPKPLHFPEYRLMFACPCHYENNFNAVVFNADYLNLPIIQNPKELHEYLNEAPIQWFKKQSFFDTCSAQVMRILEESNNVKETDLEAIASRMHMTSRTLRRKLTQEGSGFQQLKDNVRRDQAIGFFEDTSLTMSEIGRRLGFTEPATFTRAFKKWTGVSPSDYRNYSLGLEVSSLNNE